MIALYILNAKGRYYPGTNYFQPTPNALDNFLRFVGAVPLDAEYFIQRVIPEPIIRIAVACRATTHPLPLPDDEWMSKEKLHARDLAEFGIARRKQEITAGVKYQALDREGAWEPHIKALSLEAFLRKYPPFQVAEHMTELSLKERAL